VKKKAISALTVLEPEIFALLTSRAGWKWCVAWLSLALSPALCCFFPALVLHGGVRGSIIPLLSILKIFLKLLQQEPALWF